MKIKNKNKCILIIFILLIGMLLISGNSSYAADQIDTNGWSFEGFEDADLGMVLDGVAGILLGGLKLIIYIPILVLHIIIDAVVHFGMDTDQFFNISPASFIFNQVELTTINFFSGSENTTIEGIQTSIAQWYYIIRNISIIILLGILIYVGIRMAISTLAEDKAKYKQMLIDWIVSLVLVYVLHYIMIIVIEINNALVNMLGTAFGIGESGSNLSTVMAYLAGEALSVSFVQSFGCLTIYSMLTIMTLVFLIMYVKRFVIAAFLTMIAPLITITYSIDKMGDGKSQALNTWLKEYCYNILIQPFHCIIYGTLVMTSVGALSNEFDKSLGCLVLSIVTLFFMYKAEDLVKKIFGVQPSSLGSALAAGAMAMTAIKTLTPKKKQQKESQGAHINTKANNTTSGTSSKPASSSRTTSSTDTNSSSETSDTSSNTNSSSNSSSNSNSNEANSANTASTNNSTNTTPEGRGKLATALALGVNNLKQKGSEAVKHPIKTYAQTSLDLASKAGGTIAGAMLGGGLGELSGVIAAASLGQGVAEKTKTTAKNIEYSVDTNNMENEFGAEIKDWANENGINNEDELIDMFDYYRDADKDDLEPEQLKIRNVLDTMQTQYKGGGEDDDYARNHVNQLARDYFSGARQVDERYYKPTGGYISETKIAERRKAAEQEAARKKKEYDVGVAKEAIKEMLNEDEDLAREFYQNRPNN